MDIPGRKTMTSLTRRISVGLTTLGLVLAQVIMPVQVAFATTQETLGEDPAGNNGTLKVHEKGSTAETPSTEPKVCNFNFEGFGFDAFQNGTIKIDVQGGDGPTGAPVSDVVVGNSDASGNFSTAYFNDGGTLAIQNGHYKATLYGQKVKRDGTLKNESSLKSKVFKVECEDTTEEPQYYLQTSHVVECGLAKITLRNVSPWIYPVTVEVDGVASYGPTVDNRGDAPDDQTATREITFPEDSGQHTVRYRVAAGSESDLYNGLAVGEWTEFTVESDCEQPAEQAAPSATIVVKKCSTADMADGRVRVNVTNTNDETDNEVTYTVKLKDADGNVVAHDTVTLADGDSGKVVFKNVAAGTYFAVVKGSDGRVVTQTVQVTECVDETNRVETPTIELEGKCGINTDIVTTSESSVYTASEPVWLNSQVSVTFTINSNTNAVFSENNEKTIVVSADELDTSKCPRTVTKCEVMNKPMIITSESQFDGPGVGYNDNIGLGLTAFGDDGLHIQTTDSSQKIAWYHFVNYNLSNIGEPKMDYTATDGAVPGLQLVVDFDGSGKYNMLVGESIYGNNWWLTGSSSAEAKAGAPHNGGGNGSEWYGTLDEWLTAFPDAKVKAVGFSLGRGPVGNGILKSLTFSCDQWVFQKSNDGGSGTLPPPAPETKPAAQTPGKGALPTELPETGASANGIMIALLAATAAYGALYFAQPKRKFDQ
jgi:hypothetical protein